MLQRGERIPALVVKLQNDFNAIVCFQITSNSKQKNLMWSGPFKVK